MLGRNTTILSYSMCYPHFKGMWLCLNDYSIYNWLLFTCCKSKVILQQSHFTLSATAPSRTTDDYLQSCEIKFTHHKTLEKKAFYRQMFHLLQWLVQSLSIVTVGASTKPPGLVLMQHRPSFAYNIQVQKPLQIISRSLKPSNMWFNKQ